MRFNWLRWVFLLPLALAVVAQAMGISVRGRDDETYIEVLEFGEFFTLAPDQLSWLLMDATVSLFEDSVLGLRFAGLLVALLTTYVVTRSSAGPDALGYFAVSILPLYLNIYFNQVRFGVAILIYLFFLTTQRVTRVAAPAAVLGHASGIIFLFPPMLLAIPLALELIIAFVPSSAFVLRILAYANVQQLPMPWSFAWELAALAFIYASLGRFSTAAQIAAVVVACRLIGDTMSLDIARRALEVALFAYSPICLYLRTGEPVSPRLTAFFLLLGSKDFVSGLVIGVVEVEA